MSTIRIKITELIAEEVAASNSKEVEKKKENNTPPRRKRWSRKYFAPESDKTKKKSEVAPEDKDSTGNEKEKPGSEEGSDKKDPLILMVKTENLIHHPFEKTQELKVSFVGESSINER